MAVTKDLGAVTAYAHAVEGGYTGTLAEFETLMASYATVAQQAAASASDAEAFGAGTRSGVPVSSGDDAYENNAVYYAGLAEDAKDDAEAAAASLVIEDEFDEDSTNALENGVITKALETKAEIDGAYESMTVGNAEQLVSTVFVNDEEPYNFRTAGGSADIGDRLYDTIVGGTIAWNQIAQATRSGYTFNVYGLTGTLTNGVLTLSGTFSGNSSSQLRIGASNQIIPKGRKVLCMIDDPKLRVRLQGTDSYSNNSNAQIYSITTDDFIGDIVIGFIGYSANDSVNISAHPNIVDLTAMFGSTIADYIYSLEQSNAGAGVAWFKKLFPKPYYAYNTGELMSVNVSAHNTVGFNQISLTRITNGAYNKSVGAQLPLIPTTATISGTNPISMVCVEWGGALFWSDRVVVGQQYELKFGVTGGSSRITVYMTDENGVVVRRLGNSSEVASLTTKITVGQGEVYIAVSISTASAATMLITNLCCHLVWDGERDGEYEEYVKHSYPLDSDLVLRGIPKLDASNNLYYDGDTYESDGTVTRKYGVVDLGTIDWVYDGDEIFRVSDTQMKFMGNGICAKYKWVQVSSWSQVGDGEMSVTNSKQSPILRVHDSTAGTDAAAFKTAMSGVYLVYELATPTTESADPFQSPQIVDDFGTEEYVDYAMSEVDRDVAIPVGHITKYTNNLRAKLEMSPNSPDGAGDYLVRQTNGINEYVSLASNATIQDIISRLEALEGQGGE